MSRNTKIWGWHYFSLSDFKLWSTSFDFTEKLSGFLIGYSSILGDSHRFSDTPNEKCFVKSPNSQPTQKVWLSLESVNTMCPRNFDFFSISHLEYRVFHLLCTYFKWPYLYILSYFTNVVKTKIGLRSGSFVWQKLQFWRILVVEK